MSYNQFDSLRRIPSTYYSYNSTYVNKNRHRLRVERQGKTHCILCNRPMTIYPRGKFFCRIAHCMCVKHTDKSLINQEVIDKV